MFNIQFHKNIMEVEEKMALNMSAKQLTCIAIGVAIDIPVYLIGKDIIGSEATSWIAIAIGGIFAAIGFYNNNGMNLMEFATVLYENNIKTNPRSEYRKKDLEQAEIEELYKEKIVELNELRGAKKHGKKQSK